MVFSRTCTLLATLSLATVTFGQYNNREFCNDRGETCLYYTEGPCSGNCPPGYKENGRHRKYSCWWWAGTYPSCTLQKDCVDDKNRSCDKPINGGCVMNERQCKRRRAEFEFEQSGPSDDEFTGSPLDLLDLARANSDKVGTDAEVEGDFRSLVAELRRLDVLVEELEDQEQLIDDLVFKMEIDAEAFDRERGKHDAFILFENGEFENHFEIDELENHFENLDFSEEKQTTELEDEPSNEFDVASEKDIMETFELEDEPSNEFDVASDEHIMESSDEESSNEEKQPYTDEVGASTFEDERRRLEYTVSLVADKPTGTPGTCCKTTFKWPYCTTHPLHWHQCKNLGGILSGYKYDHSKKSSGSGCWWGQGRGYCSNSCGGRYGSNGKCMANGEVVP